MPNRLAASVFSLLLAGSDLPSNHYAAPLSPKPAAAFAPDDRIPLFPTMMVPEAQDGTKPSAAAAKGGALSETSKINLLRFVSGEFAKARKPIPGGKDGFTYLVDKPLDQTALDSAVGKRGASVNSGDKAQITKLEFRDRMIVVDVNGGGRPHRNWRDHIQIGMGGPVGIPQASTTTTDTGQGGPPGFQPGAGGTLYLQFPKNVPDLSPDELKDILSPFLDFNSQRSAAVHWIDTLPPEMKKAITDRKPVLGMNREEVVAAIGRPDRKVRERDSNGNETEDWIYGHPPDKTIFVHFLGDQVTSIKQYPN